MAKLSNSVKPTEDEVRVQLVLISNLKETNGAYIDYAISYARAAARMVGEELRAQVPYVLSNLQNWRGEEAREAKRILRAFLSK